MNNEQTLEQAKQIMVEAMSRRRGFVSFTRLEAREMDREARATERDALETMGRLVPEAPADHRLLAIRNRLDRMRQDTDAVMASEVRESSKFLERDDLVWRAFEDVASLLGVE